MATKVKNLTLGTEVLTGDDYTTLSGMVNQAMTTAGSKIASVTAGNDGVTVTTDSSKNAVVYAKVSEKSGNHLSVETGSGEKGLYVPWPTAADLGLGTAYVPKGSITTTTANTDDTTSSPASTWSDGWVFNMTDSGTINNGLGGNSILVKAGDNIVRVTSGSGSGAKQRWDKLSATISVPVTNVVGDGDNGGTGAIKVTGSNGTYTVSLGTAQGGGLYVNEGNELAVGVGSGLTVSGASGEIINVNAGPGIVIDSSGTDADKVKVDLGDGLKFDDIDGQKVEVDNGVGLMFNNGALVVKPGRGVTVNSSGVNVSTGDGITTTGAVAVVGGNGVSVTSGGVAVVGYKGISVDSNGVNADLDTAKGLTFTGTGGSQQVAVNAGNGLEFGTTSGQADYGQLKAKPYNGIEVTSNGVGVKANTTDAGKKNVSANANGTYVDLNRALTAVSKTTTSNNVTTINDTTTIGDIITALGGTPAS